MSSQVSLKLSIFLLLCCIFTGANANSFDDAIDISIGEISNNSISVAGENDYFRFTIEAPSTYFIFSRGGLPLEGTLYDADLNVFNNGNLRGEEFNFRIVKQLPLGTYFIKVRVRGSRLGDYALHIEGPGRATATDFGGSSFWSAEQMSIGEVENARIDVVRDTDYFRFTVENRARYYIFSQGDADIKARLFRGLLEIGQSRRFSNSANDFILEKTLSPGEYYLEISTNSRSLDYRDSVIVGDYSLHIEGPNLTSILDAEGSSPYSAITANVGDVVNANLGGLNDLTTSK